MTTRGFGAAEAEKMANLIADVLEDPNGDGTRTRVTGEIKAMCAKFPVYPR
jgi:glycine hydroxymethyltransferase